MRAREFIKEIVTQEVNTSVLKQQILNFIKLKSEVTVDTLNGFPLKIKDTDGSIEYGVFDSNSNPVVYMKIDKPSSTGFKYMSGAFSYTDPEYRGKGWIPALIVYHIRKYGPFISDYSQSKKAIESWIKMLNNPSSYLKISYYDADTDVIIPIKMISGQPEPNPWDDELGNIHLYLEL
jgi:hypothetical protein